MLPLLAILTVACAPSEVYFEPNPVLIRNAGDGGATGANVYIRNDSDADVYVRLDIDQERSDYGIAAGYFDVVPAGTMRDVPMSAIATGDGTEHVTLHVKADLWWCSNPCEAIGDPDDKIPLTIDFDMRKGQDE